jgi:hypothetical protein
MDLCRSFLSALLHHHPSWKILRFCISNDRRAVYYKIVFFFFHRVYISNSGFCWESSYLQSGWKCAVTCYRPLNRRAVTGGICTSQTFPLNPSSCHSVNVGNFLGGLFLYIFYRLFQIFLFIPKTGFSFKLTQGYSYIRL